MIHGQTLPVNENVPRSLELTLKQCTQHKGDRLANELAGILLALLWSALVVKVNVPSSEG